MAYAAVILILLSLSVAVKSQDPIIFGFNQTEFKGLERGQRYAVEVGFLRGRPSAIVIATLTLNYGTAGRNDVQLGTTFIRIFPGLPNPRQLVTFSLLVDSIAQELDETFNITFRITTPNPPPVISNVLQGTIVDRNKVGFQLTNDDYLINERELIMPVLVAKDPSQRLANPVTLRVTPLTVAAAVQRGIVEDTIVPNNEISPNRAQEADFDGTPLEIVFPADEGLPSPIFNVRADIPVVNDNIDEAHEQQFIAFLEIINATNSNPFIVRNTTICRINDDDYLQIGFVNQSYNFTEPRGRRVITDVVIMKENNVVTEQTYSVVITASTPADPRLNAATLEPVGGGIHDYSLGQPGQTIRIIEFVPNVQSTRFIFFLNGDQSPEGVESFQATITPAEGFPTYRSPTTLFTTTLINIIDDDIAVVGFEEPEYFVSETEGSVEICVNVTNPSATDNLIFTILTEYQTRTGTAGGDDFTQVGPFTGFNRFPAGSPKRRDCFRINIINDGISEPDESFAVILRQDPFSPINPRILIHPNTTTVTILNGSRTVPTTVSTTPVTSLPETTRPVTSLPETTRPVTSEMIVFGFNQTEFRGMERGERYAVELGFLQGRSSGLVIATLTLNFGTAGRNDVQLSTTFIRIFPSDQNPRQLVTFSLLVDSIAQELDETFTITFRITTSDFESISPPPEVRNTLQGTIVDHNVAEFQTTNDDYLINERELIMPVRVAKFPPDIRLANPVSLRVTPLTVDAAVRRGIVEDTIVPNNEISPNRAQEADFDGTVLEIVFPADEGLPSPIFNVRADIPVINDDIDEAHEQQFIAFLEVINATNPSSSSSVSNNFSPRNISICRINDDDSLRIGFLQQSYNYTEPRGIRLIRDVILLKENNAVTEQRYSMIITTSTPADPRLNAATIEPIDGGIYDYSLGQPGQTFITREFTPDEQSVTFPFLLNGDTFPERLEAFQATITPVEGFPTYGNPTTLFTTTLINIIDDDIAVVGFEQSEYFVNETEGFVEICVNVTNPPATVDLVFNIITEYQTRTGTASGADFTQVGSFMGFNQFLANSPIRRDCFNIAITNDDITEIDESFTLVLRQDPFSSPSSSILIRPNTTIVTISDGVEIVIGFINPPYVANERDGVSFLRFGVITGNLQREISVELSLSNGSAILGSDFIYPGPRRFTLNGANSFITVNITLINDNIIELSEIFQSNLRFFGPPPENVAIHPATAQTTILDDDSICLRTLYTATLSSGDTLLSPCPNKSLSNNISASICPCLQGYFRNAAEGPDVACTRPPSACRNLQVFEPRTRANSITIRWMRPLITGRDDYFYNVHYSSNGTFVQHNRSPLIKSGNFVEYTLSGLRVLTDFTICVSVHNGISDQDPSGEEQRRCEVNGTTGDINPQAPRSVMSLCNVVLWKVPRRAYGVITGYDVHMLIPDTPQSIMVHHDRNEFNHVVSDRERALGPLENIQVQVRAVTRSANGTWSELIKLCA